MELQTIRQVSDRFRISARTLRYYEQIGLIQPFRTEQAAYRLYDADTILRLKQIVVLRKLRIPLKQIAEILKSGDAQNAITALERGLLQIADEITALSAIRSVMQSFVERLHLHDVTPALLDDESLLEVVDSLTVSKINFREDQKMEDLNKAHETVSALRDKDVRIIYLPPAAVASAHCVGGPAEGDSGNILNDFIKSVDLPRVKPDFRHYGFNHPNGSAYGGPADDHGYERWVTIPEDMEVPAPLEKKHFAGGLYAAHMIPMGAFEEWELLWKWVENSENYDRIPGDPECMDGLMEEHLNYINLYMLSGEELDRVMQLDLLIPIKERKP